jgi:hypothetical protein
MSHRVLRRKGMTTISKNRKEEGCPKTEAVIFHKVVEECPKMAEDLAKTQWAEAVCRKEDKTHKEVKCLHKTRIWVGEKCLPPWTTLRWMMTWEATRKRTMSLTWMN